MARLAPPLAFALLGVSALACKGPSTATPEGAARTAPSAVHVVGNTFRDGEGRQLIFRGFNVKVAPLFDVTFSDGRTANEPLYPFASDAATRYEEFGFNAMRLNVNWSGFEPTPEAYSDSFLAMLDTMIDFAAEHGYYVIIDLHQDAYSKEIGEDGEPLWAITPTPTASELLSGPSSDSRREDPDVLNAGFNFFLNEVGGDGRKLQEAYDTAAARIAKHVVGNPNVLGYEAFNEPVVFYQQQLNAFHQGFAEAIHAVDRDAPVLFEPLALRNETDTAFVSPTPWPNGPGAYAPHIYTDWFTLNSDDWVTEDAGALYPSMAHAQLETQSWGTPMFITEFGCDQSTVQGPPWLSAELDLQEEFLASSTVWDWIESGGWGLNDPDAGENPTTALMVSRSYPRAVAGTIVSIVHPDAGDLVVTYTPTAETRGLPHEVSMSAIYATGYQVLCDGVAVPFAAETGRGTFVCPLPDAGEDGEVHTFEVVGTPN